MNRILDAVSAPGQDVFLGRLNLTSGQDPQLNANTLEDLAHELRQPLGAIEAIAYFLEITAQNEQLCGHMQRIQRMVLEANRILEQALGNGTEKPIEAPC